VCEIEFLNKLTKETNMKRILAGVFAAILCLTFTAVSMADVPSGAAATEKAEKAKAKAEEKSEKASIKADEKMTKAEAKAEKKKAKAEAKAAKKKAEAEEKAAKP
jgi:uncharacterized membrane protein YqiK